MNHITDYFTIAVLLFSLFIIFRLFLLVENIKHLSNKILLVIFLIFGYTALRYLFIDIIQDLYDFQFPLTVILAPSFVCAAPILFYLYVKTVLHDKKSLTKEDLIHLGVFVFCYISYEYPYNITLYGEEIVNQKILFWSNYFRSNNFPNSVLILRPTINVVYSLLTYRMLYKFFKVKSPSTQFKKVKTWLYTFTNIKLILTIGIMTQYIFLVLLGKTDNSSLNVSALIIALMLLTLVIFLNKNRNIFYNIPEYVNPNTYHNLKIKEGENLNEVFKNITHEIFIQELFLNKDFKLSWLSDNLNIKQKHITLAISENGFENFSAYSNHFKIEKAKQLIKAGYLYDYSIEALADAAGFKAVTSFYRIFKSATGLTPSKYDCLFNKENK